MSSYDRGTRQVRNRNPSLPDYRILEHGHTSPRDGGVIDPGVLAAGSTSTGSGGGSGGSSIAVTDGTHSVTPVSELDFTSGATVTDLGGGVAGVAISASGFELSADGGQSVIKAHGSLGAAATFTPTDGNVHTGTLTANCTFTLNAPVGSGACTLELRLTQDATGGRTITWPGSVTVVGTLDTTAATASAVIVETLDGGATWTAWVVGSGGGTVTSVALTVPAEFSVSGSPVTSSGTLAVSKATQSANTVWAGPSSGAAAAPSFRALVAADIPAGVVGANDHEHVMDCLFSGDGSTTAFTLPASPFDQYSVAAYVAGVLTEVTLSGADWAVATFGSAPGAGTNNIRFDIVAAVL